MQSEVERIRRRVNSFRIKRDQCPQSLWLANPRGYWEERIDEALSDLERAEAAEIAAERVA